MIVADVEILLATYNPNMFFFHKLLHSLNNQSVPPILLSVIDDCSAPDVFSEIQTVLETEITNFPFRISRSIENAGSTKTFEQLTKEAKCPFLAYCDQDDIWEETKLEILLNKFKQSRAVLCYSNLSVINENGELVAESLKTLDKRIHHLQGDDLFPKFLRRNSVTGCTMLISADVARKAIPFCNAYFVHDHWLTLIASTKGRIAYCKEPLVRYRIHGNNQIGIRKLTGIVDKNSYVAMKIQKEIEKYTYLLESQLFSEKQVDSIQSELSFAEIRMRFFQKHSLSNIAAMMGILSHDPQLILFELFIAFAPSVIGRKIIKYFQ